MNKQKYNIYIGILIIVISALLLSSMIFKLFLNNPQNTTSKNTIQITEDNNIKGNKNAPITIIKYSDVQCPYCARYQDTLNQIIIAYPNDVKIIYKHFPIPSHKYAFKAAEASECAGEQDKFWEYIDKLYKNQRSINLNYFQELAISLNLDTLKFNECYNSGKYTQKILNDIESGKKLNLTGTPSSFINNIPLSGAVSFEKLKQIIENLKIKKSYH